MEQNNHIRKMSIKPANGIEEVDYINVSTQTPGVIGRKLAYTSTFNAVETLIGNITCLRTAMDYICTPGYPLRLLTKNKLTPKDIKKIPKKTVSIANYWSIVTHLIYQRIKMSPTLVDDLLSLKSDVVFTSFNVKKNYVSGINSSVTTYNNSIKRYVLIIDDIFNIMKNNDKSEWDKKVIDLMINNKSNKDKGIFDGVPFNIDIDESIFK